jgi:hypothetical protein
MAKIVEILSVHKVRAAHENAIYTDFHGHIEPDEDENKFRLYSDPSDKTTFFLLSKNDVSDAEIYEWTSEERSQAGYRGKPRYTVSLKYGSVIQAISIKYLTVGILVNDSNVGAGEAVFGDCQYSSVCASKFPGRPCVQNGQCNNCCAS